MIGTIDITVNAEHPNVPLAPVFSWRGSASRINVEGVPCLCGSWYVSAVSIAVATPDGKTATYPCQRTCNGIWSATIEATDTPGKSANGITITATDEEGKDFVLGRGDLYILDGAAIPSPGDVSWTVRLLDKKPENPKDGDAYFSEDGTLMVYSDGSWRNTMPSAKVPTKVSELENDAGYITEKQVKPGATPGYAADSEWAGNALKATEATTVPWDGVTNRPTKLSEFENDTGFISSSNNVFLPLTGGTMTGTLKVGDKGHLGHILVQNSKGETKVRINGEQADGGTSYGGEIVVEGEPGAGGGGRLRVMNGAYGGGEIVVSGTKGIGQATITLFCSTADNTGSVSIQSGSNTWDGGTGLPASITLGDNTSDPASPRRAEITIGDVKVRATLAEKANQSSLDSVNGRVETLETLGRKLSQEKADKATTLAGYGITDAPTKTSQLENDSGFISEADGPVLLVEDANGRKTAATFGSRSGTVGDNSFSNGVEIIASGESSHGEGVRTHAEGQYSHAEGFATFSPGYGSHAEGRGTNAPGAHSHAEGSATTSAGYGSHAEGLNTAAAGNYSHAEGFNAQTGNNDNYAYSWNGDETRTEPYSSHGKGTFNINPVGGLDGFYIGEQKLSEVMAGKADKTALDELAAKVDAANTALEEVA